MVVGDEPINAAAFAIHSEIHKARPDVHAACHAHSVYGKAWSVFGRELDMMTQDSLRFYKRHSVYDNFGGVVLDRVQSTPISPRLCLGFADNYHRKKVGVSAKLSVTAKQSFCRTMGCSPLAAVLTRRHSGSSRWTRHAMLSCWLTRPRMEQGGRRS